jgi:hypothetical protein
MQRLYDRGYRRIAPGGPLVAPPPAPIDMPPPEPAAPKAIADMTDAEINDELAAMHQAHMGASLIQLTNQQDLTLFLRHK